MMDRDDLPQNQKCFDDIKTWLNDINRLKLYALQSKSQICNKRSLQLSNKN